MSSEQPQKPGVDLRPSRSQVEALLGDVTTDADTCKALVDAFETHGLMWGTCLKGAPLDHMGRLSETELTTALSDFNQSLRDKVIAVLEKVGGIAQCPFADFPSGHRT